MKLNVAINVADNVVNQQEQKLSSILSVLRQRPKSTAREMAILMNMSPRQIQRLLAKLQADGSLIRHGSPRSGFWEVKEKD